MNKKSGCIFSGLLALSAALGVAFGAFLTVLSCASSAPAGVETPAEKAVPAAREEQEIPQLIVKSSQEAVYNGKPQPISFYYTGNGTPRIIYYPSQQARKEDKTGSTSAPVRAGTYYVRIKYPDGNKYTSNMEVLAEYRIQKCAVKIETEKIQQAYYNGNPKRAQARAEPPVPLSYSYYPNRELRETAQKAVGEPVSGGTSSQRLTQSYSGYKRVDRAPIEEGTYYVWIYFPGDENYKAAHANVEFVILPAFR